MGCFCLCPPAPGDQFGVVVRWIHSCLTVKEGYFRARFTRSPVGTTIAPKDTSMQPTRTTPSASHRGLAWLLLVAMALMGLTVTRQQALGSLHHHAGRTVPVPSAAATVLSELASDWKARWQLQRVVGHGQFLLDLGTDYSRRLAHAAPQASLANAHEHDHDTLERHHHAPSDSDVVALDGSANGAQSADSPSGVSTVLLFAAGPIGNGPLWPTVALRQGSWPAGRAVLFVCSCENTPKNEKM